jgi:hypothetical protein
MGPAVLAGIPGLIQLLNHKYGHKKIDCERALALIGPSAVEAIAELAQRSDTLPDRENTRRMALEALQHTRDHLV